MTFEARSASARDLAGPLPYRSVRPGRLPRAAGVLLAASFWAAAAAARAQASEPMEASGSEPVAHVHGQGSVSGEPAGVERHHVMVMVAQGVTDAGTATYNAGVGYEYRLPILDDLLGVGVMAELMLMPAAHQMVMATASVHPLQELYLQAAIGVTHLHRDAAAAGSSRRMSSQAVARATAGYAFHLGRFMLAPYASADVARKPRLAVSAGLCAGLMF